MSSNSGQKQLILVQVERILRRGIVIRSYPERVVFKLILYQNDQNFYPGEALKIILGTVRLTEPPIVKIHSLIFCIT